MVLELKRTGIGEQGKGYEVKPIDMQKFEQEYASTGYYVSVSNKISVNRSIPDCRHEELVKHSIIANRTT